MDPISIVRNELTAPIEQAGFEVRRGWSDEIARQLTALSHQPHIQSSTPNDMKKRFSSLEAAQQWHDHHERVVYTIARCAVAGLIWFGRSSSDQAPGAYTFAIRMYAEAQGKHLARPFMNAVHADFREQSGYSDEIWLDTATTNDAAIALYHKVGYADVRTVNDRIYMTNLPTRE